MSGWEHAVVAVAGGVLSMIAFHVGYEAGKRNTRRQATDLLHEAWAYQRLLRDPHGLMRGLDDARQRIRRMR